MPNIDKNIQKEELKAAIQEWLDDKFKELGKWTFNGLVAAAFALFAYHYITSIMGYHK